MTATTPLEAGRGRRYRRTLLTGGAGFIGTTLRPFLLDISDVVVIFDNLLAQVHGENAASPKTGPRESFVRGDVRDPVALAAVVEQTQPDLIIHLAAETGTGQSYHEIARYCEVNVTGTAYLVEALRKLPAMRRRVVLTSSRAVYGEGQYRDASARIVVPAPRSAEAMDAGRFVPCDAAGVALTPVATAEDAPPSPASVYASTKLMQEYVLRQALDATDIELMVLRLQNVYGAGQSIRNPYTGVLTIFSKLVSDGHDLDIYEDGLITRDFVHVSDVARSIVAAAVATTPAPGPINIGSGVPSTIVDIARSILALYDRSPDAARISGRFRSGDVRYALADIDLAAAALDWQPTIPFDQGLKALVEWVKSSDSP